MKIDIDDAVYQHIQSQAIPFEERSPNDTLRRIFGLRHRTNGRKRAEPAALFQHSVASGARTKAPKANLPELVQKGLISEGEAFSLIDYSGKRVAGCTAQVSGTQFSYEGSQYSMSELARILLNEHGYHSTSVRGPAHWANFEGKTIRDLWDECLQSSEDGNR